MQFWGCVSSRWGGRNGQAEKPISAAQDGRCSSDLGRSIQALQRRTEAQKECRRLPGGATGPFRGNRVPKWSYHGRKSMQSRPFIDRHSVCGCVCCAHCKLSSAYKSSSSTAIGLLPPLAKLYAERNGLRGGVLGAAATFGATLAPRVKSTVSNSSSSSSEDETTSARRAVSLAVAAVVVALACAVFRGAAGTSRRFAAGAVLGITGATRVGGCANGKPCFRSASRMHSLNIATIGPTVSRAWQRCVVQHCYPQLTAPGCEVEVWTSVLTGARGSGHADQPARMRAYVVVPPQVRSICTFSVSPAPAEAATTRAEQELFVKILGCGPDVTEGNSGAAHALSSVQCVRASTVRPISRVCPSAIESWVCQEATEGSKPLAMHAATTLAAFLPFCCQRCGALAAQPQEQDDEVVGNTEATVRGLVGTKNDEIFSPKCRFGARQLRPGVRENLSWVTLEDRRKRLQCISCLILEAGEVGRPSRYSHDFASGSEASVVQDGTTLSSSQEEGPSPWLHIDFHTGGGAGSMKRAADAGGLRKQHVQQALRTREEVCEWLEAHYMGADEFCAALPSSRYSGQPRAEATVATDATVVTHTRWTA